MTDRPDVVVRPRRDDDGPALLEALRASRALSAYPLEERHVTVAWVLGRDQVAAWVAEVDGVVRGHVALDPSPPLDGEPAVAMTRLFVDPSARGRGVARVLLETVDDAAAVRGVRLVLHVIESDAAAIGLYEHRGWQQVRRFRVDWFGPDGPHPWARTYVAPAPAAWQDRAGG